MQTDLILNKTFCLLALFSCACFYHKHSVSQPKNNRSLYINHQQHSVATSWNLKMIQAPEAWEHQTDCSQVKVGIIDSGVDHSIPSLQPFLDSSLSCAINLDLTSSCDAQIALTDQEGHGTHVTGVIVGQNDDTYEIKSSICHKARIVPLRVHNLNKNKIHVKNFIALIEYAKANQIDILNVSLKFSSFDTALRDALKSFPGLIIAAAGNSLGLPAEVPSNLDLPNIIAVAALDSNSQLAIYSAADKRRIHIAAPGSNISSFLSKETDAYKLSPAEHCTHSGTSMAAPHVTAAAALLWSKFPHLSPLQVKEIILNSADNIDHLRPFVQAGRRLNLKKMFTYYEQNKY